MAEGWAGWGGVWVGVGVCGCVVGVCGVGCGRCPFSKKGLVKRRQTRLIDSWVERRSSSPVLNRSIQKWQFEQTPPVNCNPLKGKSSGQSKQRSCWLVGVGVAVGERLQEAAAPFGQRKFRRKLPSYGN